MDRRFVFLVLAAVLAFTACATQEPDGDPERAQSSGPSAAETIAAVEAQCADAQEAIQARQAASPLVGRLGGREGIRALFEEATRLHLQNERIRHFFEGVDTESVIANATDFLVMGTGGEAEYKGRDIVALHAPMHITAEDFLAAGTDFDTAMTHLGLGADEKQEVTCAFFSLRGLVMPTQTAEATDPS